MSKPPRLLQGAPYVPSHLTTVDYLRARMKEWKEQIEKEAKAKVTPIVKDKKA